LLTRRQNLFNQQSEIVRATFLLGANIAELCSATGKFFELLEEEHGTHGDASKEDAPIQP